MYTYGVVEGDGRFVVNTNGVVGIVGGLVVGRAVV